jgi:hypothetical protein
MNEPSARIVSAESNDSIPICRSHPGIAAHRYGGKATSAVGVTQSSGIGISVYDSFCEKIMVLVLMSCVNSWSSSENLDIMSMDVKRVWATVWDIVSMVLGRIGRATDHNC